MHKISCQIKEGTTLLTLSHQSSTVIVSMGRISPTNINDSRQGLVLDFNVKSQSTFNSNSTQYYLKELFSDVVAKERYIGAILKITVFLVQAENAEATIVNACWLALMRHGVPMTKSIFQIEWKPEMSQKKSGMKAVIDLNNVDNVIHGEWEGEIPRWVKEEASKYRVEVLKFVSQYFYQ